EYALHPHADLHHLVEVRVVHEGAGLLERELVLESLPGRDRALVEARDAVHPVRQGDAVPVTARRLREVVRDVEADAIVLDGLDERAGRLSVVAPALDHEPRRELAADALRDEVI